MSQACGHRHNKTSEAHQNWEPRVQFTSAAVHHSHRKIALTHCDGKPQIPGHGALSVAPMEPTDYKLLLSGAPSSSSPSFTQSKARRTERLLTELELWELGISVDCQRPAGRALQCRGIEKEVVWGGEHYRQRQWDGSGGCEVFVIVK